MSSTSPIWNERMQSSTKGRIIGLLRESKHTVYDLSNALGVTDNAVRAHLVALERDGLVQYSGTRPGSRKPHVEYTLTDAAEQLFPKPLGSILNQLLDVMGEELSNAKSEKILKEVAHRMAVAPADAAKSLDLEQRVETVINLISGMGGLAKLEDHPDHLLIHGLSCPFAEVACQHGQICQMTQMLISEIVGAPVKERCKRTDSIECYFEIDKHQK